MANAVVLATVVAIALLSASGVWAQAPPRGSGSLAVAGPVRVIDGDTLEVYIDGRQTGIGVIGIKAPKTNTPCGRRAAELLETLINRSGAGAQPAAVVRFDEDLSYTFDARKRRMYYLRLPDGVSPAAELVRAGVADPDGTGAESAELSIIASKASKCSR